MLSTCVVVLFRVLFRILFRDGGLGWWGSKVGFGRDDVVHLRCGFVWGLGIGVWGMGFGFRV
jgi:hypothetical protein